MVFRSGKRFRNRKYSIWRKKYNAAVFHFVQAAEKGVKALLYLKEIWPWGHSLVDLLKSCEKIRIPINKDLKITAQKLELHYTSSRYPDALPDQTPKEAYDDIIADDIKKKALKILDFVKEEHEKIEKEAKTNINENRIEELNKNDE